MMLIFLISIGALGSALLLIKNVLDRDTGSQAMRDISDAIKEGAAAFPRRQWATRSKTRPGRRSTS
jgi:K(+)-stimulated pyrophosphate-energized sodium pump